MRIYPDIAAYADRSSAIYIGVHSFAGLSLDAYRRSIETSVGQTISLPAALGRLAVRLKAATAISTGTAAAEVSTSFEEDGREIFLTTDDAVELNFDFGVVSGASITDVLGEIRLQVSKIRFSIQLGADSVACEAGEATITPKLTRSPDFHALLTRNALDAEHVTRVEGMLVYGALATAFSQALNGKHEISLRRLFPNISLIGSPRYAISSDKKYLYIKASQGLELSEKSCECRDAGDGFGRVKPGELTADNSADPDTQPIGTITFGGPTPVNPNSISGRGFPGQGDVGLYLPSQTLFDLTNGPYPAARFDFGDGGFVGWKAAAFIDFNRAAVDLDGARGRLTLTMEFRAEVYGSVHVDLGKLGKIRVTEFSAEQAGPGANNFQIGFYLVVGTQGIYLKPVLEQVNISGFSVNLRIFTLLGTPFGAKGAVVGFVLDRILSQLIGSQIPDKLDLELRRYAAKTMIPLIQPRVAAELAGIKTLQLAPRYDGDQKGILVSVGDAG
jgi:hypothetical protein